MRDLEFMARLLALENRVAQVAVTRPAKEAHVGERAGLC